MSTLSTKPTLLLLHGIVSSRLDWENLIPAFTAAGFPAYALDLLGHGDASKPVDPAEYCLESYLRHFEDWIEQKCFQTPYILVGHSLGGYLSLNFALRHPESVKGLVLIAPLYSSRQLSPWTRFVKRRPGLGVKAFGFAQNWMARAGSRLQVAPTSIRGQSGLDAMRASPNVFHIMSSLSDLDAQISNIHAPALVIWGTRDSMLNPRQFPPLVDSFNQASACILPKAGHEPHRDFPDLIVSRIQDFVNQL